MRLSKIKLAGFKSFVDPTVIPFVSNLSAVVGPNGCGKSNVIDAIRWVLGESSAKNLRAGQLADVIFNGSTARKPLGQAAVELHFDNSDGTLLGEYASYAEVVIRREVSRVDGQSRYSINGVRCRRRDVMDLFRGTGLNDYAIIEQGKISRVVEAKPDDLRVFIEEAAGISQYKERRRETENRIGHTKENLERLIDIKDELAKQLAHLKKQAGVAQKFKSLREEEHIMQAQLAAMIWQRLQKEVIEQESCIHNLTTELEGHLAGYQQIETQLEKYRIDQYELNAKLRAVQGQYYGMGSDITTLEQKLQFHKERAQQLERDKQETHAHLSQNQSYIETEQLEIELLAQSISELEPQHDTVQQQAQNLSTGLSEKEQQLDELRVQAEQLSKTLEQIHRQTDVEKTKITQLEEQMQQAMVRLERLTQEAQRLQADTITQTLSNLEHDQEAQEEITNTFNEKLEANQQQRQDLQKQISQLKPEINSVQKKVQQLEGRKLSLEALQQAALGKESPERTQWLKDQALSDEKCIAQLMRVQEPWTQALEMVLGDFLEALYVERKDQLENAIQNFSSLQGSITLIEQSHNNTSKNTKQKLSGVPTLYEKVVLQSYDDSADTVLVPFLDHIYLADNLDNALLIQAQLIESAIEASVITPDGIWLGQGWVRLKKGAIENDSSLLKREAELRTVEESLASIITELEVKQLQFKEIEDALFDCESMREILQMDRNQAHRRLSEATAQLQTARAQLAHKNERLTQIQTEQQEIQTANQKAQTTIMSARQIIGEMIEQLTVETEKKAALEENRQLMIQSIQEDKKIAMQKKEDAHELALALQKARTQWSGMTNNRGRALEQVQTLQDKIENIAQAIEDNSAPIIELEDTLHTVVEQRMEVETQLHQAQDQVSALENELQALEKKRTGFEVSSQSIRDKLEQAKIDGQALYIHRDNAKEKLNNTDFQLESLLEQLPVDATEELWNSRLSKLANQLQNLGAINLAAIEECAVQEERQQYLESQHADLMEALKMLEQSIEKMDKETRTRFKDTFNAVNENFKVLFPKLFGGGEATLGLTDEDVLVAGVNIIGRPPGKRNSSIHQLSGGEKALTAVSLVFSIFQLNPAPFCLLDEVDAPLDDNNVGRFCALVKEMSETVQFIYISHNKLALELAGELQGVTMREPGVSRIVTVDIEKATEMVAEV